MIANMVFGNAVIVQLHSAAVKAGRLPDRQLKKEPVGARKMAVLSNADSPNEEVQ